MRCCYLSVTAEKNNNLRLLPRLATHLFINNKLHKSRYRSFAAGMIAFISLFVRVRGKTFVSREHFLPFSAFWPPDLTTPERRFSYLLTRQRPWLPFTIDWVLLVIKLVIVWAGNELTTPGYLKCK